MRAVRCHALGDLGSLRVDELPSPVLGPGQVRLHVHAAGVNFADSLMVQGTYQERQTPPFTPGMEVAGTVAELGEGVSGLTLGQRVLGLAGSGGFTDEIVLPAGVVAPIPDSMSFAQAAGFPIAYGTSHVAFEWRAKLKAGETLLVHGAAGGVGLTAVEIGKAMGARVIAAASSAEKLAVAKSRGADVLIDTSSEDVRARIKEAAGERGVDVAYDPVGGDSFDVSLRTIAWGGRIIIIGFAGGKVPQIPANILLVKNCDVIGFYWGSYNKHAPRLVQKSFATLLGWVAEGKLNPHISDLVPLEQAAEAIEILRTRRATGKVVLTTGRS